MKRRNASLLGNVLMGLGLVVMVVGVGYSILNQLPQLDLPQFFAHGAILSIFVGEILVGSPLRQTLPPRSASPQLSEFHTTSRCERLVRFNAVRSGCPLVVVSNPPYLSSSFIGTVCLIQFPY